MACRNILHAPAEAAGLLVKCRVCQASQLAPARSQFWTPARRSQWLAIGLRSAVAALMLLLGGQLWYRASRSAQPPAPVEERPSSVAMAAHQTPVAPVAPAGEAPSPLPRETPVEENPRFRELQTAHRAVSRQYEELANWVLNNMRGRFLLKDALVKNVKISPLTEDFQLHPELADFLDINAKEQSLLEDALDYGRAAMLAMEGQFLSVTQFTPDRVAVHIPPYEKEGATMQRDLYDAMETVLGAERFGRMLTAGEQDLIKKYHYFGAATRTLIFQLMEDPQPDQPPYLVIRDGWILPDGPSQRTMQIAEASVRELPRDYVPYLQWLPDFVAAYARP
jgi:hypothetical protein